VPILPVKRRSGKSTKETALAGPPLDVAAPSATPPSQAEMRLSKAAAPLGAAGA
jgi:hypothetical protein